MTGDLTRERFGRWLVIWRAAPAPDKHTRWVCRCDCGEVRAVRGHLLLTGASRSCGCLMRIEAQQRREDRLAALRVYRDDATD